MKTTNKEFTQLWLDNFHESPPVSHWFKWAYPNSWFRIHSLPNSKRYPNNEKEWKVLLKKQNEIITDIIGKNTKIYLVSNDAEWGFKFLSVLHNANGELYRYNRIKQIDLYKLNLEYYENEYMYNEHTFKPVFVQIIWNSHLHDSLLKNIANDNARAFFVSFEKTIIIAPYDGGIDFVLKDDTLKNHYKNKYVKWLSNREDGL